MSNRFIEQPAFSGDHGRHKENRQLRLGEGVARIVGSFLPRGAEPDSHYVQLSQEEAARREREMIRDHNQRATDGFYANNPGVEFPRF